MITRYYDMERYEVENFLKDIFNNPTKEAKMYPDFTKDILLDYVYYHKSQLIKDEYTPLITELLENLDVANLLIVIEIVRKLYNDI